MAPTKCQSAGWLRMNPSHVHPSHIASTASGPGCGLLSSARPSPSVRVGHGPTPLDRRSGKASAPGSPRAGPVSLPSRRQRRFRAAAAVRAAAAAPPLSARRRPCGGPQARRRAWPRSPLAARRIRVGVGAARACAGYGRAVHRTPPAAASESRPAAVSESRPAAGRGFATPVRLGACAPRRGRGRHMGMDGGSVDGEGIDGGWCIDGE